MIADSTLNTKKTPPTFEQYLARLVDGGVAVGDHLDKVRKMYDEERLAEASAPTVIPSCPSWCRLPAGHPYDSTEWDFVTHLRYHASVPDGISFGARVEATERNKGGVVEVATPIIGVYVEENQTAEEARRYAAELLVAADLLDAVSALREVVAQR